MLHNPMRLLSWYSLLRVIVVSTLCVVFAGQTAVGFVRDGDSLWEVSSRQLPECNPCCDVEFRVQQLSGCAWQASSEVELYADAAANPIRTFVYTHGNWMSPCEARQRAEKIYSIVSRRACGPIRFILFSWPSEQRDRAARDVINKKGLINTNSFYLANLVARLPSPSSLSFIGYSFGGAVTCGGLHILGGGAIGNLRLCSDDLTLPAIRVALIAPAFDRDELAACGAYSQAMSIVSHVTNLYNSRDPILRRFRFFERSAAPVAAGFAGLLVSDYAMQPLAAHDRITQFDCRSIGRTHDELAYHKSNCFYAAIDNLLH